MASDDVREAAKAVIRRQVWESERGKATRSFLRDHLEVTEEFEKTGTVTIIGYNTCKDCNGSGEIDGKRCVPCEGTGHIVMKDYPEHVTRASVLLELNTRARRRESSAAAKQWAKEHPDEVEQMRQQIRQEQEQGAAG